MAAVMVSSCKKEDAPLSISLSIPAAGISISQGQTADVQFTVDNIPEGGGNIEVSAEADNDDFTVSVKSDGSGASGTISVQAPDLLYAPCNVNVRVQATAATGEAASASFTVAAVMYEGYVELSSPSNCHIVEPGAFVKFPASIGNTSEKASFTTAELLWQDNQGLVSAVNASPDDGTVYVMLSPDKSGNALIAVKDADGTVTWSYHLWVTGFDPETGALEWTDGTTSESYKIMDRNLGAVSTEPGDILTNGLFYQWGRKDPFAAPDNEGDIRVLYDMAGNTVEKIITQCADVDNVTVSIANPLTHYSGTSGGDWSWITTEASVLASDATKDLWGGISGEKSKYDPCPEGWQVATSDVFGFASDENTVSAKVYRELGPDEEEPSSQNTLLLGWNITVSGKDSFFPAQGEVQHGGSFGNGIGTNWPCTRSWSSSLDEYGRGLALGATPSSAALSTSGMTLGYELPVRCVKK